MEIELRQIAVQMLLGTVLVPHFLSGPDLEAVQRHRPGLLIQFG
jgi:hypothetical protein